VRPSTLVCSAFTPLEHEEVAVIVVFVVTSERHCFDTGALITITINSVSFR
jgi:hypothetical protein